MFLITTDQQRQILRHMPALDGFNTDALQCFGEIEQGLITPEFLEEVERDYEIVDAEENSEDAPQDAV